MEIFFQGKDQMHSNIKVDNLKRVLNLVACLTTAHIDYHDRLVLIQWFARNILNSCDESPDESRYGCECEECKFFHNEVRAVLDRLLEQQYKSEPVDPKHPNGIIISKFIGDNKILDGYSEKEVLKILEKL